MRWFWNSDWPYDAKRRFSSNRAEEAQFLRAPVRKTTNSLRKHAEYGKGLLDWRWLTLVPAVVIGGAYFWGFAGYMVGRKLLAGVMALVPRGKYGSRHKPARVPGTVPFEGDVLVNDRPQSQVHARLEAEAQQELANGHEHTAHHVQGSRNRPQVDDASYDFERGEQEFTNGNERYDFARGEEEFETAEVGARRGIPDTRRPRERQGVIRDTTTPPAVTPDIGLV